jgi:hypothetical protein
MRFHFTPTGTALTQTTLRKGKADMRRTGRNREPRTWLLKTFGRLCRKSNIKPPHDPTKTHRSTPQGTENKFTAAQRWGILNAYKCTSGCMTYHVGYHTMGYYTVLKRNEELKHAPPYQVSQTEKATHHLNPCVRNVRTDRSTEDQGRRRGRHCLLRKSLARVMDILEAVAAQHCTWTKHKRTV